jgi:hypothetical protein
VCRTVYPIEFADAFGIWWDRLSGEEQESIDQVVGLLEERGFRLGYPYSSDVKLSKHGEMRELRVQHAGQPYRIFYCFDPRQIAVLLIGDKKTGVNDKDWYKRFVPIADRLYREHLEALEKDMQV